MKKDIRDILMKAVDRNKGNLSPAEMINGIAGGNDKLPEWLVVHGFLEHVPVDMYAGGHSYRLQFYRVTEKGYKEFEPWYKKIWFNFHGDIRTILVAVIAALLTTLGTIFINHLL